MTQGMWIVFIIAIGAGLFSYFVGTSGSPMQRDTDATISSALAAVVCLICIIAFIVLAIINHWAAPFSRH